MPTGEKGPTQYEAFGIQNSGTLWILDKGGTWYQYMPVNAGDALSASNSIITFEGGKLWKQDFAKHERVPKCWLLKCIAGRYDTDNLTKMLEQHRAGKGPDHIAFHEKGKANVVYDLMCVDDSDRLWLRRHRDGEWVIFSATDVSHIRPETVERCALMCDRHLMEVRRDMLLTKLTLLPRQTMHLVDEGRVVDAASREKLSRLYERSFLEDVKNIRFRTIMLVVPTKEEEGMSNATSTPAATPSATLGSMGNILGGMAGTVSIEVLTKALTRKLAMALIMSDRYEMAEALVSKEGRMVTKTVAPLTLLGLAHVLSKNENEAVASVARNAIAPLEVAAAAGLTTVVMAGIERWIMNDEDEMVMIQRAIESRKQRGVDAAQPMPQAVPKVL